MPVIATNSRNFVRVMKFHMAREGGKRDFAAFQLTPPLGSNMVFKGTPQRASKEACVSLSSRMWGAAGRPRCTKFVVKG